MRNPVSHHVVSVDDQHVYDGGLYGMESQCSSPSLHQRLTPVQNQRMKGIGLETVRHQTTSRRIHVPAPDFADVLRARRIVNRHLPRTPLLQSLSLSKLLGCQLYLKFENHQPIGAFKVRGAESRFLIGGR